MKQTFVKAALVASCLTAVACKQAPTAMGPGQYAVITVATSDCEILINNAATIKGRQDIAIYILDRKVHFIIFIFEDPKT